MVETINLVQSISGASCPEIVRVKRAALHDFAPKILPLFPKGLHLVSLEEDPFHYQDIFLASAQECGVPIHTHECIGAIHKDFLAKERNIVHNPSQENTLFLILGHVTHEQPLAELIVLASKILESSENSSVLLGLQGEDFEGTLENFYTTTGKESLHQKMRELGFNKEDYKLTTKSGPEVFAEITRHKSHVQSPKKILLKREYCYNKQDLLGKLPKHFFTDFYLSDGFLGALLRRRKKN